MGERIHVQKNRREKTQKPFFFQVPAYYFLIFTDRWGGVNIEYTCQQKTGVSKNDFLKVFLLALFFVKITETNCRRKLVKNLQNTSVLYGMGKKYKL